MEIGGRVRPASCPGRRAALHKALGPCVPRSVGEDTATGLTAHGGRVGLSTGQEAHGPASCSGRRAGAPSRCCSVVLSVHVRPTVTDQVLCPHRAHHRLRLGAEWEQVRGAARRDAPDIRVLLPREEQREDRAHQ